MSGSNIGDGLITTLTTASAFDVGNVTKNDYGILGTTAACALVVAPARFEGNVFAYGHRWQINWAIDIDTYIKDTGDPVATLNNVWTISNEVIEAIRTDPSLNSSACQSVVSSMDNPREGIIEIAGNNWLPVYFTVTATETLGADGQTTSRDAYLTLESSGSTKNVSGDTSVVRLEREVTTAPFTAWGDSTVQRDIDGVYDWTLSASCHFSDTAGSGAETLVSSLLAQQTVFQWAPAGSSSGNTVYTGSGIIDTYEVEGAAGNITQLNWTMLASAGSLTRSTL